MKSSLGKVIGIVLFGLIGSILIIAAMPLYRVNRVFVPALESARTLVEKDNPEQAIDVLGQLDSRLKPYPPLYRESALIQVRGWVKLKNAQEAQNVASNILVYLEAVEAGDTSHATAGLLQGPAARMALGKTQKQYGSITREEFRTMLEDEIRPLLAPKPSRSTKSTPTKTVVKEEKNDTETKVYKPEPIYIPKKFPAWAAIKTPDASTRSRSGKATAKIRDGALVGVKGPCGKLGIYPCILTLPSGTSMVVYVSGKDLDFHDGSISNITPTIRRLAAKRGRTLAAIHKIEHLAETTNPYRHLLLKVQKDRAILIKKIPVLTEKRDSAQGVERIDANNDLQTLKDEIAALDRREKTLKASMTEWIESKKLDTSNDAKLAELRDTLQAVTAELNAALDE